MIRINLIQTPERAAEAKVEAPREGGVRKEVFPLVALVASFAVVGLFFWVFNSKIDRLNRQLALEQQEAVRLSVIEAQNRQYESRLEEINRHIEVVQTLEKGRTGPRDVMTQLGAAADRVNGLYLLSVETQGNAISMHGESDNPNAVANFIAALESSGSFSGVQLHQVFEDDQRARVSFKFDLECFYTPPVELAASVLPAPPSGGAGRPPGR